MKQQKNDLRLYICIQVPGELLVLTRFLAGAGWGGAFSWRIIPSPSLVATANGVADLYQELS